MNILLFTDADVFAGTERHMLDLARVLRENGESVRIACPRPGALADRAAQYEIPVVAIPKQGHVDRNAIRILVMLLQSGQVDVIHAHNGRTHIAAAAAVKKAGRGVCIATQHFLAPARTTRSGLAALIARSLHKRAARSTAHTIAISDAVRDAALARKEVAPDAITTVHNGIYPPDLAGASGPAEIRETLNLTSDNPMIFCAARLQPEKDLSTLIDAMKTVAAVYPSTRCFIAGEGEQHEQLQEKIDQLRLGHAVTLLGFRNDIPALLRACDILVLPSPAEPFGLVLLEAMALSKPVIACDAGGPREIVKHLETGLLIPPSNRFALAEALNHLVAKPALRLSLGAAGLARYRQLFTAQRMAAQTLAIYQKALNAADPFPLLSPPSSHRPSQPRPPAMAK